MVHSSNRPIEVLYIIFGSKSVKFGQKFNFCGKFLHLVICMLSLSCIVSNIVYIVKKWYMYSYFNLFMFDSSKSKTLAFFNFIFFWIWTINYHFSSLLQGRDRTPEGLSDFLYDLIFYKVCLFSILAGSLSAGKTLLSL